MVWVGRAESEGTPNMLTKSAHGKSISSFGGEECEKQPWDMTGGRRHGEVGISISWRCNICRNLDRKAGGLLCEMIGPSPFS